jgi:hypothetical protein
MKTRKPISALIFGVMITVGGFVYHGFFAGIPFQDPTPEVYANWLFHSRIGDNIILAGLVTFLASVLWLIIALITALARKLRAD